MNKEIFLKLYKICDGLNRKFPGNKEPFRILARLMEECGEIAQQVHHFENIGRKIEKHGQPNKQKLAKEIQDILTSILSLAKLYNVESELEKSINKHYQMVIDEGLIDNA
jgi:NTP pyrophosphatase (non-canonical NTP hydrolase)